MKRIAARIILTAFLFSSFLSPGSPAAAQRALLRRAHSPVSLNNPSRILDEAEAVSAGAYHTCALVSGGKVMCWGLNTQSQLGNNGSGSLVPVEVTGLVGVTSIAAGGVHTCALSTGGGVLCWGSNEYGQLGNNSTVNSAAPVGVVGLGSGVIAIAAGYTHTCALQSGGTVLCWGYNLSGMLGDGSTTDRWTPVPVSGLAGEASAISAGGLHTCVRLTSGGIQCWGNNFFGQLGDGSRTDRHTPVYVSDLASGMAAVSAGYNHTCALTSGGGVKCWGYNTYGQVGDNSTTEHLTPVDVNGLGNGITAISAAGDHSCALAAGGGVKCWGANFFGQVGDGTGTQRLVPTDVIGLSAGVAAVSTGMSHSCVLIPMGSLKCWGNGSYGQLGDGSGYIRSIPVDVVGFEGGLTINHIEVSQVTQDEENGVPLIAHKPTLVRVYLHCGQGCASLVPLAGVLSITSGRGSDSQGSTNTLAAVSQSNDWRSLRGSLDRTLNFIIRRSDLLEGDVTLNIQVGGVIASRSLQFIPGNKLRVYWTDLRYQQGSQVFSPDFGVASTGSSDLQKLFPLGNGDLEYTYQPGDLTPMMTKFTCEGVTCPAKNDYIKQLNRLWDRLSRTNGWAGGAAPDRLYGWVPNAAREPTKVCGISDPRWAAYRFDPWFDLGKGRVAAGGDYCDKPFGMQLTPARVLAHELAHDLDAEGIRHTPNEVGTTCFARPDGTGSYPNASGLLDEFGVDAAAYRLFTPTDTHDFMAYCTPTWASKSNYERLLSGFTAPSSRLAAPAAPTPQLLVSGTVISPSLQVNLDPFYQVSSETPADPSTGGDWCFELRGSGDELLDQRCFSLSFRDPEEGALLLEDSFSLAIPFPPGTARIVLSYQGITQVERAVSATAPSVTLIQPNGGEALGRTGSYTATWSAVDPDSSLLAYSLDYSRDHGASWVPLGIDLAEPQLVIDLARLGGGEAVLFRAGASDGVLTGYDTSDSSLTVGKKAPLVTIAPLEGGNFRSPMVPVYLQGYAFDLEDGTLPDASLTWSSSLDGSLGSGSMLLTELSPGVHTLTLSATDSDGNAASDAMVISVGYRVFLPLAKK